MPAPRSSTPASRPPCSDRHWPPSATRSPPTTGSASASAPSPSRCLPPSTAPTSAIPAAAPPGRRGHRVTGWKVDIRLRIPSTTPHHPRNPPACRPPLVEGLNQLGGGGRELMPSRPPAGRRRATGPRREVRTSEETDGAGGSERRNVGCYRGIDAIAVGVRAGAGRATQARSAASIEAPVAGGRR